MLTKLKYLAYGSNLHPGRLGERISFNRILGQTTLEGYKLLFHKRSTDGSGKCDAFKTNDSSDKVIGVIYEIDEAEKAKLDSFEGLGSGYNVKELAFQDYGTVFTYLADEKYIDNLIKPYIWYKELVLVGAKYHGFPKMVY